MISSSEENHAGRGVTTLVIPASYLLKGRVCSSPFSCGRLALSLTPAHSARTNRKPAPERAARLSRALSETSAVCG